MQSLERKRLQAILCLMNFWKKTMQTLIPVHLLDLHLTAIRAIIDKSLGTTMKKQGQQKYENMSIGRHTFRGQK